MRGNVRKAALKKNLHHPQFFVALSHWCLGAVCDCKNLAHLDTKISEYKKHCKSFHTFSSLFVYTWHPTCAFSIGAQVPQFIIFSIIMFRAWSLRLAHFGGIKLSKLLKMRSTAILVRPKLSPPCWKTFILNSRWGKRTKSSVNRIRSPNGSLIDNSRDTHEPIINYFEKKSLSIFIVSSLCGPE